MRSRTERYFEADKARIEVIPMIDIMLFLLCFFVTIQVFSQWETMAMEAGQRVHDDAGFAVGGGDAQVAPKARIGRGDAQGFGPQGLRGDLGLQPGLEKAFSLGAGPGDGAVGVGCAHG